MPQWTSETIELHAELLIQVRASAEGVTVGKHVDGVFASDTLYTPEQAEELAKALIEASAKCRGM